MILTIGEILFDLFPQGKQLGGAPFNFAFHLKQLGFDLRFISRVGKDGMGDEIHSFLSAHGFDLADVPMDPDHATGTVEVSMSEGGHGFTITEDTAWDHLEWPGGSNGLLTPGPDLIYFGSLIQRSPKGKQFLENLLKAKPASTKVFSDINLRPGGDDDATIDFTLAQADILKLNWEELVRIWSINIDGPRLDHAIRHQMLSHGLEAVILTLGEHGSLWVSPEDCWECEATQPDTLVNTVGAGDAFAAVCAAGIIKNMPPGETMELAAQFSGRICANPGALPQNLQDYVPIKEKIGIP